MSLHTDHQHECAHDNSRSRTGAVPPLKQRSPVQHDVHMSRAVQEPSSRYQTAPVLAG